MSVFAFAFGAGVLATVNPCGFAMLAAFLGYLLHGDDHGGQATSILARLGRGFVVGVMVTAGFAGVFVAAGLLVVVGLRALVQAVPWAAVVIGGLLIIAGLVAITGRQFGFRPDARTASSGGRGWPRVLAFGAGYAVASLSCTLPVTLALLAQATATASPARVAAVFAAYTVGAATILVSVAVTTAAAKATVAGWVHQLLPAAGRLGGVLLVLSGGYLIAYWLPALAGAGPARPVAAFTEAVSARLTGFLEVHQTLVGGLAVLMLAAGAGTAVLLRWRGQSGLGLTEPDGDCCAVPGRQVELG